MTLKYFDEMKLKKFIAHQGDLLHKRNHYQVLGTVTHIMGMRIEAAGLSVPVGTKCKIQVSQKRTVFSEVIAFSGQSTYLVATDNIDGLKPGAKIIPQAFSQKVAVSAAYLGRIIDGNGLPIDGKGPIHTDEYYALNAKPINPLARRRVTDVLDVGVRAINALFTIAKGQRLGIFARSGVGKSILLGMMTRFTAADVVIVGLVGERGREVKEFIEENLQAEGLAKSVVIAAPADTSPVLRMHSAALATTFAEYFRDQGKDVLLIVDSLTRFAQAQRELALSAGELPATKGFAPSVFAKLSQLIERSGNNSNATGSITALYTVLSEGGEEMDPISEHVKSVLDGHIYLSKRLADEGIYPAIDIDRSISRVMHSVINKNHLFAATQFKKWTSAYTQNKELIQMGMYQAGHDLALDQAIQGKDILQRFVEQSMDEAANFTDSIALLNEIVSAIGKS